MELSDLIRPLPFTFATQLSLLVLALPLCSFLYLGISGKKSEAPHIVSSILLGISLLITLYIFVNQWGLPLEHSRFLWFSINGGAFLYQFTLGVLLDNLTIIMLLIVCLISFLVHIFSIEYMKGDDGYTRYFAFLGLFTFSMLGVVLADNLLLIFIFWELVGFSSYLLIGFWYKKDTAAEASKKAFLVNKIGDVGLLLGLMILWTQLGTLDLAALKELMLGSDIRGDLWVSTFIVAGVEVERTMSSIWLFVAGLGIFCGVVGKSAQFPLQVWLPSAMEGPTPVSALIHAATMVAAGVFLLARVFVLMSIDVLTVIAFVGAITAFMGAFAAFTQNDIKKVLAYSTISQLGYMVMAMGVGAYDAALFHLVTHAFFKACLFLTAGSIIYSMHKLQHELHISSSQFNPQDMRLMGGLRKNMPITFYAYTVSMLSLIGVPIFSGFLSKDAILSGTLGWASVMMNNEGAWVYYLVPIFGFITVGMTAAYMVRQFFLLFMGENRVRKYIKIEGNVDTKISAVPPMMKYPVILLSILSLGIFFNYHNPLSLNGSWIIDGLTIPKAVTPDNFIYAFGDMRLENILISRNDSHTITSVLSIIILLLGATWAYFNYKPSSKFMLDYFNREKPGNILQRLSRNNWHLDSIYQKGIVKPSLFLSRVSHVVDNEIIDPFINLFGKLNVVWAHIIHSFDKHIVDGIVTLISVVPSMIGKFTRSFQGGLIQMYIVWALFGLIIILFSVIL